MEKRELQIGEVVQLNPETTRNRAFAGCFMVVTELKSFGAQGYIPAVGSTNEETGDQYFYRARWEEMEPVGFAEWIIQ